MRTDPAFDLLKKCSFRDLPNRSVVASHVELKVGKMQVQIPDRVRVDVTMPADAFDPVSNIALRLFAAEEQCWPGLDNTTQPVAKPSGHRDQQLHRCFRLAGAAIA